MTIADITRRAFLRAAAVTTAHLGATAILPSTSRAGVQETGNPLRLPAEWTGGTLTAAPVQIEISPGRVASLYAINGTVPAPTIRVRHNDRFAARVVNGLGEDLVLHWHGILSPPGMDGNPRDAVGSGQSYEVDFRIRQRPGTYWYHAHTDRLTGKQVYLGLAGLFIVEGEPSRRLGLPTGEFDVPLLIQDRRVEGGEIVYDPTPEDVMTGFLGHEVFVNNTPAAYLDVKRARYRFRLLNGSNARVYLLGISDERPVQLIANDAGLLPKPVDIRELMLAPGERAEILADFSGDALGTTVVLKSHEFMAGGGHGMMASMDDMGHDGMEEARRQGMELDVLTFRVTGPAVVAGPLPRRLARIRAARPGRIRRTRRFVIDTDGSTHTINGEVFDLQRLDFSVGFDRIELWEFENRSDELHPMHPHGAVFQVVDRDGSPDLPPQDLGWKDTVLVNPNETVRVAIRFGTYTGRYVLHCHNLEHEDDGMMQNFEVGR